MVKQTNLLAVAKPRTIKLTDGKEYTIPPINLTTLANIEKTMGFGFGRFASKMETEPMTTLRALVFALFKESHPDIEIEELGRLITIKEIDKISGTISEVMSISS